MRKSSQSLSNNFEEEILLTLEHQMIPTWERHGLERLAVSAPTLQEFHQQELPEMVKTGSKHLKGKRIMKRADVFGVRSIAELWPEDDQLSTRFPILIFVREGTAEFQVANYWVKCPQGHFFLFAPGVLRPAGQAPHLEKPRENKTCEVWWIASTGIDNYVALFNCKSKGDEHHNSKNYYILSEPRVVHLFHFFTEEVMDMQSRNAKAASAMLQAFLVLLLREIKEGRFYDRGIADLPKHALVTSSPIGIARQYINKNLNHPLTIDDVSQAVFMSRTNFTKQFREETGQTFQEYLTQRRLEEAKVWLCEEGCSVEVACKFVGLKHSRFHEMFKQHFGISPAEFRRQHKKCSKPEFEG